MINPLFIMLCYLFLSKSFHTPYSRNICRMKQIHMRKEHNHNLKKEYILPKENAPKEYKPKGPNQKIYVQYLNDPNTDIVLGVGPAGSGKTLFACYTAIQELKKGTIQKIIMTRPLVSVDEEEIGFLPGDLMSKMDPWTRPIFDILSEYFNQQEIKNMVYNKVIEISPLAYMRGRTFNNAFIIADEMQNSSPNQMLMMTTRLGKGTKLVITGDIKQSDRTDENGLMDFITRIKKYNECFNGKNTTQNNIQLIELSKEDIERSPIVVKILNIYQNNSTTSSQNLQNEYNNTNKTHSTPFTGTGTNTTYSIIRPKKIFEDCVKCSQNTEQISQPAKTLRKPFDDCALIPKDKIDY